MLIAVDMDNVLCNLQETVINLYNERYKTNYTLEDFDQYDIANVLPMQDAIMMKAIYSMNGLYKQVKPLSGAREALQRLISKGHDVYIVSDVIPSTYAEKVEFIHHYFPMITDDHIIAMKHKHLLRCDLMIEDNVDNLLAGYHYHRICMDYAWNRDVMDWPHDIYRCSNWTEVLAAVKDTIKKESE